MKNIALLLVMLMVNLFTVNSQTNDTVIDENEYFIKAHSLAANNFNDSLLRQYVLLFPEGKYIDKAKDNIDITAWQKAHFKNTNESYQEYLATFPHEKAAKLAEQKLSSYIDTTDSKKSN